MPSAPLPFPDLHGLVLIALLVFLSQLGIPVGVPLEAALLIAGSASLSSMPALLCAVAIVAAADLLGTAALYAVARWQRLPHVLRRRFSRGSSTHRRSPIPPGTRGIVIVFFARLLPLVRMYVALLAGLGHVRARDYLAGAAPAAVLWAGTPLALGYLSQDAVQRISARATPATLAVGAAAPMVIASGALAWRAWRRSRTSRLSDVAQLG